MNDCDYCDGSSGYECKSQDCPDGTFSYKMELHDSNGEGWGSCTYDLYRVRRGGDVDVVYNGSLETGYSTTQVVCLANACYEVFIATCDDPDEVWLEIYDHDLSGVVAGTDGFAHFCTHNGTLYNNPTPLPSPQPSAS